MRPNFIWPRIRTVSCAGIRPVSCVPCARKAKPDEFEYGSEFIRPTFLMLVEDYLVEINHESGQSYRYCLSSMNPCKYPVSDTNSCWFSRNIASNVRQKYYQTNLKWELPSYYIVCRNKSISNSVKYCCRYSEFHKLRRSSGVSDD
jgi:hypothetical protein